MQINEDFDYPEIVTMVYPDAVMLEGILNKTETTTYRTYMTSLHAQVEANNMTNVHQLLLDPATIPLEDWCAAHPSAAADADIAAQLSAFIVEEIPKWPRSTYPLSVDV